MDEAKLAIGQHLPKNLAELTCCYLDTYCPNCKREHFAHLRRPAEQDGHSCCEWCFCDFKLSDRRDWGRDVTRTDDRLLVGGKTVARLVDGRLLLERNRQFISSMRLWLEELERL